MAQALRVGVSARTRICPVCDCQDFNCKNQRQCSFFSDRPELLMDIMIHDEGHGLSLRSGLARTLEGSHAPAPCAAVTLSDCGSQWLCTMTAPLPGKP